MDESCNLIKRMYPDYFALFELPKEASGEAIEVYRACRSGTCDKDSFLPTYEEQGYVYKEHQDPKDPGVYSLSTFEKPNHVKLFAGIMSDMHVPYVIAKGKTEPKHGVVQRTKERKPKSRSHVDWWLYKDSRPYEEFSIIDDFEDYLKQYKENINGGKK